MKKAFKHALPFTIPVVLGYMLLGVTYGIMISQMGFDRWLAPFISLTVYAGSMQFVLLPLLQTDISVLAIVFLTVSVNIRMIFYGLPLLSEYKNSRSKFLFILTLSDETFALDTTIKAPADVDRSDFYLSIGIINYIVWAIASYIGAVIGDAISFNTYGLDFVLTALFLVLTVEQYQATTNHKPLMMGFAIAIIALLIFGPNNFMIPALLLIVMSLLITKEKMEVTND